MKSPTVEVLLFRWYRNSFPYESGSHSQYDLKKVALQHYFLEEGA